MMQHTALSSVLALAMTLPASTAYALKFHSYVNDRGETVFSNVPAKCVKDSSLTCMQYHPLFAEPEVKAESTGTTANGDSGQQASSSRRSTGGRSPLPAAVLKLGNAGTGLDLNLLDRVVEMNQLIDTYYPARPDPAAAQQVREQQQEILEVLEMIRKGADTGQQTTINKAIEVLRSNLAE